MFVNAHILIESHVESKLDYFTEVFMFWMIQAIVAAKVEYYETAVRILILQMVHGTGKK